MKFIISLACLSSLVSLTAFAEARPPQEASSTALVSSTAQERVEFAYPELQVSPRASERVLMEARTESKSRKIQLLPIQVSALSTLLAGALAPKPTDPQKSEKDDVKYSRQVAVGVGLSWLVFSYFFNEEYSPYIKAYSVIKGMPDKTAQDELVRERIAQEHIEAAAFLGKKMMWASAATNLAASVYLASNTANEGAVYAAAAGLLSFAPFVFRDRWQTVNHYHQEYKKRIYAPIAMPTLMLSPRVASTSVVPGFTWQLNF